MNEPSVAPINASQPGPDGGHPPPRVWLRIAIGALAVVGMVGGWWVMGQQKSRKQLEAVRALQALGCRVYFAYQWKNARPIKEARPPEARWIRALVGSAPFRRAVAVDARSGTNLEIILTNVKWLPYVEYLDLSGTALPASTGQRLRRLKSLRSLNLAHTAISDQDVLQLLPLTQLQELVLADTQVTDGCAPHLAQLRQLQSLDVSATRFSADAVQRLQTRLPKCRISSGKHVAR